MRAVLVLSALLALAFSSRAEVYSDWEVLKVQHELLDAEGETTSSIGDLKEKAKYQRELSLDAKRVSGIRFFVHWKAPSSEIPKFAVKIELRGVVPATNEETFTQIIKLYRQTPSFSGWTTADITGNHFAKFGRVVAWKVTLLQDGKPMASRASFTWDEISAAAARNKEKS